MPYFLAFHKQLQKEQDHIFKANPSGGGECNDVKRFDCEKRLLWHPFVFSLWCNEWMQQQTMHRAGGRNGKELQRGLIKIRDALMICL